MLLPARLSLQLRDMWAPLQPLVNSTVGLTSSDQLHDIVFERFDWPGEHLLFLIYNGYYTCLDAIGPVLVCIHVRALAEPVVANRCHFWVL